MAVKGLEMGQERDGCGYKRETQESDMREVFSILTVW